MIAPKLAGNTKNRLGLVIASSFCKIQGVSPWNLAAPTLSILLICRAKNNRNYTVVKAFFFIPTSFFGLFVKSK